VQGVLEPMQRTLCSLEQVLKALDTRRDLLDSTVAGHVAKCLAKVLRLDPAGDRDGEGEQHARDGGVDSGSEHEVP
jgi:hypothetical protein